MACLGSSLYFRIIFWRRKKSRADTDPPCSCAAGCEDPAGARCVHRERSWDWEHTAYLAVFLTIKFLYSGLASQIKRLKVLIATLEEYSQKQQSTFFPYICCSFYRYYTGTASAKTD